MSCAGTIAQSNTAITYRGIVSLVGHLAYDTTGMNPLDITYSGATLRAIVYAIGRIAAARAVSMATLAIAWVLRYPVVDAPSCGPLQGNRLGATSSPTRDRSPQGRVAGLREAASQSA
jgi:aryl-alcohol dehydrogenase-like predicted oxidoreductase